MKAILRRNSGRDLLSQLHQDFNQLLEPFHLQSEFQSELPLTNWIPTIDVREDEKCYLIHADLPGVKVEDIDVNMENGMLTIKGKRECEVKDEKENFLRVERSTGSFFRQITLPETIDKEQIQAKCKDGVLEIKLPKIKQAKTQKVRVVEG